MGMLNYMDTTNPWAAALDGITKGFMNGRAMSQESAAAEADLAQKKALLQIQQDAADKLNEQAIRESKAQQALSERIAATQDRPIQAGLMSQGDIRGMSMPPQQPMQQIFDPASMRQPMLAGQPMTQQDWINHAGQYVGTPTSEYALKMAAMKPEKTNVQALIENVLKDPTKYDKRTLDIVSQLTGVGVGAKGDAPKYSVEERYDDKTHTTYGRDFFWNNGKKEYVGDERPIKGRESTRIIIPGNTNRRAEFKDVMSLRKEFSADPVVKDFVTIDAQAQRAKAALKASLGNGSNMPVDQTLITVFNKMLDPTSVVRESEYARTPQDLGMLSRIKGKWDKIQKGGAGLDLNERKALLGMVDNFHAVSSQQYRDTVDNYSEIARRGGFDPRDVIKFGHTKRDEPAPNAIMNSLPDATQHKGRVVLGSDGIKRVSDGSKWVIKR